MCTGGRWNYNLVEEKRPNEFYPIQEDERGTYVFNSQDLCLLSHLPELIETGISSLKIEGRMKSAYYVATIVRAYRNMIDACYEGAAVSDDIHFWMEELQKVSHRPYTTGFISAKRKKGALTLEDSQYIRPYVLSALCRRMMLKPVWLPLSSATILQWAMWWNFSVPNMAGLNRLSQRCGISTGSPSL